MIFDNKTILVTGGCGSFGQKFVEIILKEHNPKSIRIYDNRELSSVEMERKFNDPRLRFFLGDVRDKERLSRAMHGVDVVVHAAALKHVSVCEYNPIEAIRTNVDGTASVINAALDAGVERAIEISTDKAVCPVNLYGATKMVAEKLFVQANSYGGGNGTKFSCTRYGNVIGSSGSVVPLFLEQKKNGEITITDEQMTRFWITLEDGVHFVTKCIELMKGGEIFVPKIPSMKITELADTIAPGVSKKQIGVRPGEKIHEILLTEEEAGHSLEFDDFYIIEPEFNFWDKSNHKEGKRSSKCVQYSSDKNTEWMTQEQLNKILNSFDLIK